MKLRYLFLISLLILTASFSALFLLPKTPAPVKVLSQSVDVIPQQPQFQPIYGTIIRHGLPVIKALTLTLDADAGTANKKSSQLREFLYQPKIIETLESENIPATIFVTGLWAKNHSEVLKNLSRNRLFEIGNHSYSHPAFSKACTNLFLVDEADRVRQFKESQQTITDIIGWEPKLFRFPGGCHLPKDLETAKSFGLTVVHWDTDAQDAFGKTKDQLVASIKKQIHPGAIILLHLNGGESDSDVAGALPEIISYAKENGYIFIKAGEMLSQMEAAPSTN